MSHLTRNYGGRAVDLLTLTKCKPSSTISSPSISFSSSSADSVAGEIRDTLLAKEYPYIEAEVIYAARYEYAMHAGFFFLSFPEA